MAEETGGGKALKAETFLIGKIQAWQNFSGVKLLKVKLTPIFFYCFGGQAQKCKSSFVFI